MSDIPTPRTDAEEVTPQARSLDGMDMPLTVTLRGQGGWWTAICPELMVSGMGSSPMRAMEAVGRSIESTLWMLIEKGHIDDEIRQAGPETHDKHKQSNPALPASNG